MLASGAHVSIGGVEYYIDEGADGHYTHGFESLFAPTSGIAGEVAAQQLRPEKLLWSITDWAGGEGAVRYYPQNPTQYDQGSLMNVTKRGQLTTRTQRYRSLVARAGSNADTGKRPWGISAYVNAFIAWEDNIITSANATSWSAAQDTTPDFSAVNFSDAISDGTNAAFLFANDSTSTDEIPVVQADTSTTTWADMHSAAGNPRAPMVGAVLDGVPYVFASDAAATPILHVYKKAVVMDTAGDWSATDVYNTGVNPVGTWGTNYWTAMTAAETAMYLSYSTKTHGFVWEIRNDVGRPFWTAPVGFAIKELIYHMGILFAIGNQAAAGNSFATIWAIPLSTQTPLVVAEPRRHQNVALDTFSRGCAGNGPQLFLADEDSGKIFVYDIEKDALSLFDDLANGGTGDGTDFVADTDKIAFLAMHGARLFTATWEPGGAGTSLQIISWDDLEVQNRDDSQAISATLETAEWDFGLPMEIKALHNFVVTFKVTDSGTTSGLVANSRIKISYSIDDASYVDTTVITSATTPSGAKGRVKIPVTTSSSTVKFTRLKVKITLDNNSSAVAPPILYGVMVEAEPLADQETWELAVKCRDEEQDERPTTRANRAAFLRDNLEDLSTNKNIVSFLDGYRYDIPNEYSTHTVRVELIRDDIETLAEGTTRIRLRSTT